MPGLGAATVTLSMAIEGRESATGVSLEHRKPAPGHFQMVVICPTDREVTEDEIISALGDSIPQPQPE